MIPVLFTQSNSNYSQFKFADCYDQDRNALNYKGHKPIIAHPPCRLWSRLRYLSTAQKSERLLAVWAITRVRALGGVLEHPAGSALFRYMKIPLDGSQDVHGGFVISVNQHWFGFPAQKRTYLYIVGCDRSQLPPFPLCFDAVEFSVSNSRTKKEMKKKDRSMTPRSLCEWLFAVQQIITSNLEQV